MELIIAHPHVLVVQDVECARERRFAGRDEPVRGTARPEGDDTEGSTPVLCKG